MPTVPVSQNMISLDVPSYSAPANTAVSDATTKLAAQISDQSFAINDQLVQAEAVTQSAKAVSDTQIKDAAFQLELKNRSSNGIVLDDNRQPQKDDDGNPLTVTRAYKDWSEKMYADTQLALPTVKAQKMYQQSIRPHFTESMIGVSNLEIQSKVLSSNQSIDQLITDKANRGIAAPSESAALSDIKDLGKVIDGTTPALRNTAQSLELKNKGAEQITLNHAKGALDLMKSETAMRDGSAVATARHWVDLLTEKDSLSQSQLDPNNKYYFGQKTFASQMDPSHRAEILGQMTHFLTVTAPQIDRASVIQELKDIEAKALMGQNVSRDTALVRVKIDAITNSKGGWDTNAVSQMLGSLNAAVEIGKTKDPWDSPQDMATHSNAAYSRTLLIAQEADTKDPSRSKRVTGQAASNAVRDQIQTQDKADIAMRQADVMDYAKKKNPNIGKVWNQVDKTSPTSWRDAMPQIDATVSMVKGPAMYGKAMGTNLTYWRPISKPDSKDFGDLLNNQFNVRGGPEELGRMIYGETGKPGMKQFNSFPSIVNQVVKDGNAPKEFIIVAHMPSLTTGTEAISLMGARGDDVIASWRKQFGINTGSEQQFYAARPTKEIDLIMAAYQRDGLNTITRVEANSMVDLIDKKAMLIMTQGQTKSNTDAHLMAMKAYIGDSVNIAPVNTGMNKGKGLATPQYIDGRRITEQDNEDITLYLKSLRNGENIFDQDIATPPDKPGGQPIPPEMFARQIAEGGATVSYTKDNDGDDVAHLYYIGRDTSTINPVLRSNGTDMWAKKVKDMIKEGRAIREGTLLKPSPLHPPVIKKAKK